MENPLSRAALHIKIAAAFAVIVLAGAVVWRITGSFDQKNAAETFVATDESNVGAQSAAVPALTAGNTAPVDPINAVSDNAIGEIVGAYAGLQQQGEYSSTTGAEVAGSIGMGLQAPVSYTPIAANDVQTSSGTSYNAMMQYRAALQKSLKPLLNNTTPEYELFGMYVQTKQQKYLDELTAAAANYSAAASSTAALAVPADAVQVQIGLVNSMNEFATTLNDIVAHASDPIASTVLLENYNQAENDVLNAFQALVVYEQSKTQ